MYKTITIKAGSGGWGGPLTISPTEKCNKILSVTGGGIHPVAQRIAEMTGGEAVDGFKETLPDDEVLVESLTVVEQPAAVYIQRKESTQLTSSLLVKQDLLQNISHQRFMYQQLQKMISLNLTMLDISKETQQHRQPKQQLQHHSQNQKHRQKKKLQKQVKVRKKISLSASVKLLDVW